ncbi:MAG: SprT-like domain-containing protein [Ferruginibacter sp.]
MPKQEVPLLHLKKYLPEESVEDVLHYLNIYKVQLTVTRKRETILGDYRHSHPGKAHRISVNGNLNKYNFLITLLHELAHLLTFEKYGHRVLPHGTEWKKDFSQILTQFLSKKVFPPDIEQALLQTLHNPAASSCGDEALLRTLRKYDVTEEGKLMVEQLPENSLFSIRGGRVFRKGMKLRTRFKCQEIATRKWFLFNGVYEVTVIPDL